MKITFTCAHCGHDAAQESGAVNRARAKGANLYCGRACANTGRRKGLSDVEKRAAKASYDAEYRRLNRAMLKAKKAARYAATVDREKERAVRKMRMPQHVEYCRRPEYRKWKADYDKKYCARKGFGAFGEAAIILNQLQAEILTRATRYEIDLANDTLNKKLKRRRDYERQTQRR